jgi:predicted Zn-dependent protease
LATPIKESQDRQKTIQAATNKVISLLGNQPHNPEGLRLLGQVYILAGHFQNALYTANQVLKDAPQDLEAWIQMGVAEARMNSIDQFVKEWPAPSASASPWNQLALTCASVGMWEEAQTYLGKAGGATPNLLQMGDIAIQLKQTRRAWDYLRRATEATPEDPRPWLRLSDIAAAANNTKDASDFLVEAAKRNADTNELATRRQKLGITAPPAMTGAVKTMIR